MDTNLLIQYILVGICIIAAIVWICVKFFGKNKKNGCNCGGCSFSSNCTSQKSADKDCCKKQ